MIILDDTKKLLGKTVTVKLVSGLEIIAKLMASYSNDDDESTSVIQLDNPKIVVISVDKIAIVPYCYTSNETSITIGSEHVVSVSQSSDTSSEDYITILAQDKAAEEVAEELTEKADA
jgi:hypothetical protein